MSLIKISITGGTGAILGAAMTIGFLIWDASREEMAARQVCNTVTEHGLDMLRGLGE